MSEKHHQPFYYTGWKLAMFKLRMGFHFLKYLLLRKRYPRFVLSAKEGGLLKTVEIGKDLERPKVVRFQDRYYFDLMMPPFPSKAFDFMAGNGGLNIAHAGTEKRPHTDQVVLAITRKCGLRCTHCYELYNLAHHDSVPIERWKEVIRVLQERGVSNIVLSGGEPMQRFDDLLELLRSADKDRSAFQLHTAGQEVSLERAIALRKAGLTVAGVALDDFNPKRHDAFRRSEGVYEQAIHALECFNKAGIFTYMNLCATKEFIRSGDIWSYYELAKKLNVGMVQIAEPRMVGGYAKNTLDELLSDEDKQVLLDFNHRGNTDKEFREHPMVLYIDEIERAAQVGCRMGGLSLFYIDSLGDVRPCMFVPVSFGNIVEEDFETIWARMRGAVPGPLDAGCTGCAQGQCPGNHFSKLVQSIEGQHGKKSVAFEAIEEEWKETFDRFSSPKS